MSEIEKAANILKRGGIVIFPTDTVFGIGCKVSDLDAIRRLYKIKSRKGKIPTHILVSNFKEAGKYALFSDQAKKLSDKFWPGPLTMVVKAKEIVPKLIKGPNNTIGIRQPNHKVVEDLINLVGEAILAPSANFTGETPPNKPSEIDKRLVNLVDYVVPNDCGGSQISTIVEVTGSTHRFIRYGAISKEKILVTLKE